MAGFEQRVAYNEEVFRRLNERLRAGHWPDDDTTTTAYRCECANLGCNALVELAPVEYERVRAHPRRFVVVAGHEAPDDVETVVERLGVYLVVEKKGEAGRIAAAEDPRDPEDSRD